MKRRRQLFRRPRNPILALVGASAIVLVGALVYGIGGSVGVSIAAATATPRPLVATPTRGPVTPAPTPTPTSAPFTPGPSGSTRTYNSPLGTWSVQIPADFRVEERQGRSAIFRTYDSSSAAWERNATTQHMVVPTSDLRIDVQWIANPAHLTAKQFADGVLNAPGDGSRSEFTLVSRRDDLTVAGSPSTLVISQTTASQAPQRIAEYFVLATGQDHLLWIQAWPLDSVRSGDIDRLISSLSAK